MPHDKHITIYDLLAMSENERNEIIKRAFELAALEDFEIFEANEVFDYPNDLEQISGY